MFWDVGPNLVDSWHSRPRFQQRVLQAVPELKGAHGVSQNFLGHGKVGSRLCGTLTQNDSKLCKPNVCVFLKWELIEWKKSPIRNLRCSCLWEPLAVLETSSTCFWIKWWGSNAWQACWVSALVVLDGELPMLQTWDMESGSTWASPLHGQSTGFCAWHMIL